MSRKLTVAASQYRHNIYEKASKFNKLKEKVDYTSQYLIWTKYFYINAVWQPNRI